MRKFFRRLFLFVLLLVVLLVGGAYALVRQGIEPNPKGSDQYIKLEGKTTRRLALTRLEKQGIIRNAAMAEIWAKATNQQTEFKPGTYFVRPGMTIDEVFDTLQKPVKRMVRIPEGWWIARVADVLADKKVCSAEDYIAETRKVDEYRKEFKWIPSGIQNLEGYLFPDTYDFPPGTTASEVVREQLGTYEKRVIGALGPSADLKKLTTIASMVELEAAKDEERPRVAGVIYNRIRMNKPLEIDATVLFALQRWFVLPPGVVRTVKSPYNTYLNSGLPPGPIGNPSLLSIKAAAQPESHPYIYYVAQPDRTHLFSRTYAEHLSNIRKVRALAR